MNVKTLNGANLLLPAKPGDHVWLIVGLGFYEVRECIILNGSTTKTESSAS